MPLGSSRNPLFPLLFLGSEAAEGVTANLCARPGRKDPGEASGAPSLNANLTRDFTGRGLSAWLADAGISCNFAADAEVLAPRTQT
jgi:hypothetical protein